ncbi:hypothetical protein RRG08_022688, partial [Elysia crispata]
IEPETYKLRLKITLISPHLCCDFPAHANALLFAVPS